MVVDVRRWRGTPGTVVAAAVLTFLGAAALLVVGFMFALGTRDGRFLGRPVDEVGLAGVAVPVDAVPVTGVVVALVGVVLVVFAVLALVPTCRTVARIALTTVGAVAGCVIVAAAVTGGELVALVPVGWTVVAVVLLWLQPRR